MFLCASPRSMPWYLFIVVQIATISAMTLLHQPNSTFMPAKESRLGGWSVPVVPDLDWWVKMTHEKAKTINQTTELIASFWYIYILSWLYLLASMYVCMHTCAWLFLTLTAALLCFHKCNMRQPDKNRRKTGAGRTRSHQLRHGTFKEGGCWWQGSGDFQPSRWNWLNERFLSF